MALAGASFRDGRDDDRARPDTPDPADRTMARRKLVTALDEVFPQWRSYANFGEPQRAGVPLNWLAATRRRA